MKRREYNKSLLKYVDMDMIELYDVIDDMPDTNDMENGIFEILDLREEEKGKIVRGVKFICEHQGLTREELISELDKMGCDYDISDIEYYAELFNETLDESILDSIKNDKVSSAVSVIANIRSSEFGYNYCKNQLLQEDSSSSLYHYVRTVGDDPEYKMKAIKRYKRLILENAKTELLRNQEKEKIISGLKYFCENKLTSYEEYVKALDELGCTYTIDDVERISELFKEDYDGNKWNGMNRGLYSAAVDVIVCSRASELSMYHTEDGFLSVDNDSSVYHFIRKVTNNPNYESHTAKHR